MRCCIWLDRCIQVAGNSFKKLKRGDGGVVRVYVNRSKTANAGRPTHAYEHISGRRHAVGAEIIKNNRM